MQTVVKIKLELNNGQSVDNEFVYKDSFLSVCDDMIKKIENIDLNNTTCKEAFDILYNIQQFLKNIQ